MRQQINLYRGRLVDQSEPLQSKQAGLLLLVVVIIASMFAGFSYWQFSGSQKQLAALEEEQNQLSARVDELEKQYPEPQKNALLGEKIRRLEMQIGGQRQALSYFADKDTTSNETILASLQGLASHPYKGLWLRRVRLMQEGAEVELAGSALMAEQIPEYLQMIGDNNVFGGKVFAQLKVMRMQEQRNRVDFTLGSTREKN
jgi:Tfp pilus assembly protein PilN